MEKEGAQPPGCVPSCLILRNAKVFCCHILTISCRRIF